MSGLCGDTTSVKRMHVEMIRQASCRDIGCLSVLHRVLEAQKSPATPLRHDFAILRDFDPMEMKEKFCLRSNNKAVHKLVFSNTDYSG